MAAEFDRAKDMNAHVGTYSGFTSMMKWGTIIAFIIAMIVVWLISS